MFISFEGIDGSGKTTQARLLAEALQEREHDVVAVREPGGTVLGEQVRTLLLDPTAHIEPRAELLLFSAARAQLVATVIRPALERGAVVIADRFFDSSTAYQGVGRGLADAERFDAFHAFVTAGLAPDRTVLVDVPLATAAARRGDRKTDRMEQGDDSFFARVRDSYLHIAETHPQRFLVVDGQRDVDRLHAGILKDVLHHLNSVRPAAVAESRSRPAPFA